MVSFRLGGLGPNSQISPPGQQKFGDLPRVPLGPKFPKSIGRRRPPKPPRPKVTIGQLGGFAAQIFPKALPKDFWQQRKCWLESPQSSLWVSFGLVAWGPKLPKFIGRPGHNRENGEELWGKSWLKTPIFPMVSFGGDQVPKFYLDDPPPGHQKFGDLLRAPLGPKFPKSIGRRRPPRPKVTIGKLGGVFSPDFPPKKFWQQRKRWLENPQSSLWWGELW